MNKRTLARVALGYPAAVTALIGFWALLSALASATWGVPHLTYHVFNAGDLATVDLVANLGGLVAFVAFATTMFVVARELPARTLER